MLAIQKPEFKIVADFKILAFQNHERKIAVDFKILAYFKEILNSVFWQI